jgi:hypothetical protein
LFVTAAMVGAEATAGAETGIVGAADIAAAAGVGIDGTNSPAAGDGEATGA